MSYSVELISIDRKEDLADRYFSRILYEVKSDVYGCCIKLLTDLDLVKDRWSESFYSASHAVRSHGRLYVFTDPGEGENRVLYDPQSKTAFLFNVDFYGWIKSLALSLAGDVLEDEHRIYSLHGACLDLRGKGLCLLGSSGAGKTTHTYGLLRDPRARVVSDDWFFARIFGKDILAYGSERNFYIRADLAETWREFEWLVEKAEPDERGRAVVDLRWAIGKGRILPMTTLETTIILKRDPEDGSRARELAPAEALAELEEGGYFNPHLLVKSDFKRRLRSGFFWTLLARSKVYEVNTAGTPEESQTMLRRIAGME